MLSEWLVKVADRLRSYETVPGKLEVLYGLLLQSEQRGRYMSQQLDALIKEVAESRTVVQSATALLATLAQRIEQLKDDPVKLQELADELNAQQEELTTAITMNTPAAEEPEDPEEPPVDDPNA